MAADAIDNELHACESRALVCTKQKRKRSASFIIKFTPLSLTTFEKYHNIMSFLSFYYVTFSLYITLTEHSGSSNSNIGRRINGCIAGEAEGGM